MNAPRQIDPARVFWRAAKAAGLMVRYEDRSPEEIAMWRDVVQRAAMCAPDVEMVAFKAFARVQSMRARGDGRRVLLPRDIKRRWSQISAHRRLDYMIVGRAIVEEARATG